MFWVSHQPDRWMSSENFPQATPACGLWDKFKAFLKTDMALHGHSKHNLSPARHALLHHQRLDRLIEDHRQALHCGVYVGIKSWTHPSCYTISEAPIEFCQSFS